MCFLLPVASGFQESEHTVLPGGSGSTDVNTPYQFQETEGSLPTGPDFERRG